MGAGPSESNGNEDEDCWSSRHLFLEGTDNVKRRQSKKKATHVEYGSLEGYGYHFKSKAILKNPWNVIVFLCK